MSPGALLLLPASFALWPLIDHWLRADERISPLERATLSLALSPAWISLGLFWLGLLPGRWISGWTALLIALIPAGIGLALNPRWINPAGWATWGKTALGRLLRFDLESWLVLIIIGSALITLAGTLYYPFTGSDTLSRYGLQARELYELGRMPDTLYGYPLNVQLGFVVSWFASGGIYEGLAKALPWMLGMGSLLALYLLGREIESPRLGLLSAALCAITPMFSSNVGLAYLDLPTTFPVTLALLYVLRWHRGGRQRDALLAGLLIGVALWTKQSALTFGASLAALPLIALLGQRGQPRPWRVAGAWAALLLPPLLIAGPWYLRNLLVAGPQNILPSAGLFHTMSASHSLLNLIPPLGWPRDFGYWLAPVYAAGWLWGAWRAWGQGLRALRGQAGETPADLLIALFGLPYWLAWLTQFTFEARFLLLVLPLMALWAARPLAWLIEQTAAWLKIPFLAWQGLALLISGGLLLGGARGEIGGLYHALRAPLASYDEKRERLDPTVYPVIEYIRAEIVPGSAAICIIEAGHGYYLYDYHPRVVFPRQLSDLAGCDYLLHSTGFLGVYTGLGMEDTEFYRYVWHPEVFEPVMVNQGLHLMRVLRTTPLEG